VKTRGVPSGYVEDLNDARTKLADFFSILLVGHFVVIQPDMVSEFMDHRVTNLLNDFGLRSTQPEDRPSINVDTWRQLTGGLEERRLTDRDALIQA